MHGCLAAAYASALSGLGQVHPADMGMIVRCDLSGHRCDLERYRTDLLAEIWDFSERRPKADCGPPDDATLNAKPRTDILRTLATLPQGSVQ